MLRWFLERVGDRSGGVSWWVLDFDGMGHYMGSVAALGTRQSMNWTATVSLLTH